VKKKADSSARKPKPPTLPTKGRKDISHVAMTAAPAIVDEVGLLSDLRSLIQAAASGSRQSSTPPTRCFAGR